MIGLASPLPELLDYLPHLAAVKYRKAPMTIMRPKGMGEDLAPWRMFKDIEGDPRAGQTDAMRFAQGARNAERPEAAGLAFSERLAATALD